MSEDTRRRIIAATLQTVREQGVAGTSARAISAAGGFNTSLLFYHFGSVEGALIAAAEADTQARIDRYRDRMEEMEELEELVAFARDMHRENLDAGHVTVLVQMLALTSAHPDMRAQMAGVFDPWIDLVRTTLERLLGPDGLPGVAGNAELATGITSLFLGMELLTHLGDRYGRAEGVLDAMQEAAGLLRALLALGGMLDGSDTASAG